MTLFKTISLIGSLNKNKKERKKEKAILSPAYYSV
jgi:hypothetical protein